jgi:hypothetical protein
MNFLSNDKLNQAYHYGLKFMEDFPNVVGVDVGFKYKDHKRQNSLAIRFWLLDKQDDPEQDTIPDLIFGVPTDVIQSPKLQLATSKLGDRLIIEQDGVVQSGDAIFHPTGGDGTLGALIRLKDGHIGILTAGHVITPPPGEPNKKFTKWHTHDKYAEFEETLYPGTLDAAIARIREPGDHEMNPEQKITGVHVTRAKKPDEDELLFKFGRGTGFTWARFDGEGSYEIHHNGHSFTHFGYCLRPGKNERGEVMGEISKEGDSGAIWYNKNGEGIGITVKGETDHDPGREFVILAPLVDIIDEFERKGTPITLV